MNATSRQTYPSQSRRHLYRSRNGWIFGVCRGLADYAELSPFWVRVAVLGAATLTGIFPILFMYVMVAIVMKPEPVVPPVDADDLEFYNSLSTDRHAALTRLKRKFERLERRAERMENIVTRREFEWEERLNSRP